MYQIILALLAPFLFGLYFYRKNDHVEKDRRTLIKAFFLGLVSIIPICIMETFLDFSSTLESIGNKNIQVSLFAAFYASFVVAGLSEELVKYIMFKGVIWDSKKFNSPYSGLLYCIFISLGFATGENIFYVLTFGGYVAIIRGFTAIPAHVFFGVFMGYYFVKAKFHMTEQKKYLWLGLLIPILLHGIYDFILISKNVYLVLLFIPFMIFMIRKGMNNIKDLEQDYYYKLNDIFEEEKIVKEELLEEEEEIKKNGFE